VVATPTQREGGMDMIRLWLAYNWQMVGSWQTLRFTLVQR